MNRRGWTERRELKDKRVKSGYTSARLSKLTLKEARELEQAMRYGVTGLDELIYELVIAEKERRSKR